MEGFYVPLREKRCSKTKIFFIIFVLLFLVVLGCLLLSFVGFPFMFKNSIGLERKVMFTMPDVPKDKHYFEQFYLPGYKNRYVTVKDEDGNDNITIGLWHILPTSITRKQIHDADFDFEDSLKNSNVSVLLYFHGTGESRADFIPKYHVLREMFHVITIDYRGYADSTNAPLFEHTVVNDCVQIYKWLMEQTNSPIYVWGHSLGSSIATHMVSILNSEGIFASGLILESPFTSMADEIYVHPYGRIFSWLPWFKFTVIEPLNEHGFRFNTSEHLRNTSCPVMLLHGKDDSIVPYKFSQQLALIAAKRSNTLVTLHLFESKYDYDHYFIYQDPFLPYFIWDFLNKVNATVTEPSLST